MALHLLTLLFVVVYGQAADASNVFSWPDYHTARTVLSVAVIAGLLLSGPLASCCDHASVANHAIAENVHESTAKDENVAVLALDVVPVADHFVNPPFDAEVSTLGIVCQVIPRITYNQAIIYVSANTSFSAKKPLYLYINIYRYIYLYIVQREIAYINTYQFVMGG